MKISIITVSYNSINTIRDTLDSIFAQSYQDIEAIVIDGASTDGTIDIIEEYHNLYPEKLKWISEKDDGIYDAMNKGLALTTGQIIGILNSDDYYFEKDVLERIVGTFIKTKCDGLYANLIFVDPFDKNMVVRKWMTGRGTFKKGWNPPHPTVYLKREIYEQVGEYNTEYRIAADYDFLYRVFQVDKISMYYLNESIIYMRYGGASTGTIRNIIRGNKEIWTSLKKSKNRCAFFIVLLRLARKIFQ